MNELKQLRRSRRWTQTTTAARLQITRAQVSLIERAGIEPDLKLQARIAALLRDDPKRAASK